VKTDGLPRFRLPARNICVTNGCSCGSGSSVKGQRIDPVLVALRTTLEARRPLRDHWARSPRKRPTVAQSPDSGASGRNHPACLSQIARSSSRRPLLARMPLPASPQSLRGPHMPGSANATPPGPTASDSVRCGHCRGACAIRKPLWIARVPPVAPLILT